MHIHCFYVGIPEKIVWHTRLCNVYEKIDCCIRSVLFLFPALQYCMVAEKRKNEMNGARIPFILK
jgi:hypothetical protein